MKELDNTPKEEFEENKSYDRILKTTMFIGGSSLITVFLAIIRTKAMAVFLGPFGVGLIGLYGSITGIAGEIAGMGISRSGVRQIAEAVGSKDQLRIATTITTLRRVAVCLGVVGMVLVVLLRYPICQLTFGNTDRADSLALLSITLFFSAISGGQMALVQGMRRISDLSRLQILGALFGTLFSIPIVYVWGERGIVPFLVMVSGMGILTSWLYARKISFQRIPMGWGDTISEASALLRLGLVFMTTALMSTSTLYCVRLLIVRQLGIQAVGLFHAANSISMLYVNFILTAMGSDFYPRLTAAANDYNAFNRMVNEQTEVSLLLAIPGVLTTITLAPYVIELFYSATFAPATEILRWHILGVLLTVTSWPMGFMLLARGNGKIYFCTELAANLVHIALVLILLRRFGLPGTGMAFFFLHIFYWALMFGTVRRLSGFSWTPANMRIAILSIPALAAVFLSACLLPKIWGVTVGITVTFAISVYCLSMLCKITDSGGIQGLGLKLKARYFKTHN